MKWTRRLAWLLAAAALVAAGAVSALPQDERLSVLGEFTPSKSLPAGPAIEALDFDQKAAFTRAVMSAVPLQELATLFGLESRDFRWAYRSGGCEQSIAPNLVVTVAVGERERARVSAFALAWMYVYGQDAVPFFGAGENGAAAVRLRFEQDLTPAREGAMFGLLKIALGKAAGYTRVSAREIVVIDFAATRDFGSHIDAFRSLSAAANPILDAQPFTARTEYRAHDWHADPLGEALVGEIGREYPGTEAVLRHLRARYQRFVSGWLANQP